MCSAAISAIWIILSIHLTPNTAHDDGSCLRPYVPVNGRLRPWKSYYAPGEVVSFSCSEKYTSFGDGKRQCLSNGTWDDFLPLCYKALPKDDLRAFSTSAPPRHPVDLAIDENPKTCTYTENALPRWFRVDIGRQYVVRAVNITVPRGIYAKDAAQLTVYVNGFYPWWKGRRRRKCASYNGTMDSSSLQVTCSGNGLFGDAVTVEDDRITRDKFGLCDIQIYVPEGIQCRRPDMPAKGQLSPRKMYYEPFDVVSFTCDAFYSMFGDGKSVCLSNGTWVYSLPVCYRILPKAELWAHSSSTLSNHHADLAIDEDPKTCTYTENDLPRWVSVNMIRPRRQVVKAVILTVPEGTYAKEAAQLTVYVTKSLGKRQKCASFNGTIASSTLHLTCGGDGVSGQFVSVVDNRKTSDNFSFCDIKILVKEASSTIQVSCSGEGLFGDYVIQVGDRSTHDNFSRCDIQVFVKEDMMLRKKDLSAYSSTTLDNHPVDLVLDEDSKSCTYTKNSSLRWIHVNMGRRHRVRAVSITVPEGMYSKDAAQLSLYVYGIPTVERWKCASYNGTMASTVLWLTCSGKGLSELFLEVMDERRKNDNFALCDIQIFVEEDESKYDLEMSFEP